MNMNFIFTFIVSLFNEHVIVLRTLVYTFGWVTLISSTIIVLYKSIQFYYESNKSSLSKLLLPLMVGWLVTMNSLGIVCTFYVFDMAKKGMLVTFPVFVVWACTMAAVYFIASRWGFETIKQYEELTKLNRELKKANIRLEELDELKSKFISVAAHQLRTPLTAVKWAVNTLLDGDDGSLNEKQKSTISKIFKSNSRLIDLVNDLLSVSKIESGELDYSFEKGFLPDLIKDVIVGFKNIANEKDIEIKYIEPKETIPEIKIDIKRFRMAIENIVDNAIKYNKKGGILEISIWTDEKDVNILFSDTGIGISEDQQEHIFSKFFRGRGGLEAYPDGSGLGLFISQEIIKKHNGGIVLESKKGKGTRIHIKLPLN